MKERVEEYAKKYIAELNLSDEFKEPTTKLIVSMISHEAFGNPDYEWSLNDFELGHRLGRGKFGRVYVAREKQTGYLVALKTMLKKEIVIQNCERQILREVEIQSHLKHPNILQLLAFFHDDFRIYLVLEYAGKGELYKQLRESPNGRFDEHRSAKYIYQVADAVSYCHQNNVIHRDIKPENLLLTGNDDVKLADFGWSVHAPSNRRKTMSGTTDYLPPEIVQHKEYGPNVDLWCLGVLCYEFLVGNPPFESEYYEDTYRRIREVDIKFPSHLSDGSKDLITKLLVYQPQKRLSLIGVMSHFWVVENM